MGANGTGDTDGTDGTGATGGPPEGPAGSAPRVTLEGLLSVVGAGAVEPCVAPRGLGAPVTGVTVLDETEPATGPGELLLVVGVDPESAVAVDIVRRAGEAGAAAVVFGPGRSGRPSTALREAAEETGTVVLLRTAWSPWAQLVSVLRAGLASVGVPPDPAMAAVAPGDLDGLAEAVAALVDGAVTIEDTRSRVLAYSSEQQEVDEVRRLTILGRRVPEWRVAAMREDGFFRALWSSGDVLHRPARGDAPERLVAVVRAGGEPLGSIWVAAAGRPLAPNATDILRAAARTAAPHLIRHRTRGGHEHLVEEAVRALLEGRGSPEAAAERAVLPARGSYAVLAVRVVPGREDAGPGREDETSARLSGMLTLHCAARGHRAVAVLLGGAVLVVVGALEAAGERAEAQVARLGASLVRQASAALGAEVRIGLGEVVDGPARLPESRRSAEEALRALLETRGAPTHARVGEVAEAVGMGRIADALEGLSLPPQTPVARLAAFDAEHGGISTVETLRAYLDHFGDVPAASRALGVHPNSLRYRLRRLVQVSGIDLADPDSRLLAQIQLRLLDRGA
ncbi:PucR family transcriptional regulator [Streptomyces sp. TRM43335]|uniref:PucR family transcriptional regulator n=1 Tax=Streptomyces taklimakanensis TaxID=2569853 RepID=A0A6G2B9Q3_9ACTN|nr:PucR family transcriptional regulator [Streptomyces taklimakanensis]MTE18793.1 PucR family transcriptional regulator [Streptomyces taklimakanensis]